MSKYSQHNGNRVRSVTADGVFSTVHVAIANTLLALFGLMLFMGYLAMNNVAAASGFTIKSLERKVSQLRDEQKKLDLEAAGKQTLGNIESKVDELGLVPVGSIIYLNAEGNAVAKK